MITVNADKSWQDLAVAKELTTLYNYRANFLGMLAMDEPTTNDVVCAFVASMQTKLTAPFFFKYAVKPSSSFSGIASGSDYPIAYETSGIEQLYSDAGIASGFRRCTTKPSDWTKYNDAAYSYGKALEGDIIGPWLFVDMQKMLQAVCVFKIVTVQAMPELIGHYTTPPYERVIFPREYTYFEESIYDATIQDYPITNPTYQDGIFESLPTHNFYSDWYYDFFQQWVFTWKLSHSRFGLRAKPLNNARDTNKEIKYYARVLEENNDIFWSYPYGARSTSTKLITSIEPKAANNGNTVIVSGDRITNAASIFPARPNHSDDPNIIKKRSSKLVDLVARIKLPSEVIIT